MLCFLTYDDEHHRIGLISRPEVERASETSAGLEHIAFTFSSLERLLATFRRLKHAGITPYWSINHGPTVSIYYKDPDGNRVEMQYDVFEHTEHLEAFFGGGAYLENFIGIRFDPEEMIRRYESGEPLQSIISRPALPKGLLPWNMLVT